MLQYFMVKLKYYFITESNKNIVVTIIETSVYLKVLLSQQSIFIL